MQRLAFFLIIIGLLILPANLVFAEAIHYNKEELTTEITAQTEGGDFQAVLPKGFTQPVDLYVFNAGAGQPPKGLSLVSRAYDYYFLSAEITDQSIFRLTIKYQSESLSAKHLYAWDYQAKIWKLYQSLVDPLNKTVTAEITGRKGQLAVFEIKEQISRGTAIAYADQSFKIKLPVQTAGVQATTTLNSFYNLEYPTNKNRASDIYQYDIKAASTLDFKEPIEISIKYQTSNELNKSCYYWDNNKNSWIKLPSITDFYNKTVTAVSHLPFSRVALFDEPDQYVGEASWYSWKGGNFAASHDWPKGAKLKVINTAVGSKNFGKSVIVTVNDYGPEERTGRVIDLDKIAYQKIGNLKGGVMAVLIEPLDNKQ